MTRKTPLECLFAAALAAGLFAGCEDWDSSDGYNTSQAAGINLNISGTYTPREEGALVAGTNITRLIVQQTGNTLEIYDNNQSFYGGVVAAPELVSQPDALGNYPIGADLMQTHIQFDGRNNTTGKGVAFVGLLRVVAITEIETKDVTITISEDELEQVTTRKFEVRSSSARCVVEGNWVEGGEVYEVDIWAPLAGGSFTYSDSSPYQPPQPEPWPEEPVQEGGETEGG